MERTPITAHYYERPDTPWCILGKVTWGIVTAVKVPEDKAAYYVRNHGFKVLISDSEFPVAVDDAGTLPEVVSVQSNPARRKRWVDHDEGQSPDERYR